MGEFTGNIVVEIWNDPDNPYRVHEDIEFHSGHRDSGLLIRCESGFQFNGTSMPWILRWLISPDDPSLLQCAAIHDKGFQTGTLIMRIDAWEVPVAVHRDVINAFMSEAMLARKVAKWKRFIINTGLSLRSGPSWRRCAALRGLSAMRTDTTR